MRSITSLLLAGTLLGVPAEALAQRGFAATEASPGGKVALVIGNSRYADSPLRNPVNDARDMAASLRDLGFRVIQHTDATNADMKRAIREFGDALRRAEVGLFYFAGHGIQAMGRNFLIPVDAVINNEPEVEYESVDVGFVLAQMEAAGSGLNIVILDACRNNPFARSFRSASRGLTQVSAPTGTLIAYATAPGSVASDGDGENGLYTQELLRFMNTPGLGVEEVFKQVRISLNEQTGGQQTPWESSSLVGDFYFSPAPAPQAVAQTPPPAVPATTTPAAGQTGAAPGPVAASPNREPPPPAPSAPALAEAVTACIDVLDSGDPTLFDRLYAPTANPTGRQRTRDWVGSAVGRGAERGADLPGGVRLTPDGQSATVGVQAALTWRSAFGGRRSTDLPIEATLQWAAGRWQLSTCSVVGDARALR